MEGVNKGCSGSQSEEADVQGGTPAESVSVIQVLSGGEIVPLAGMYYAKVLKPGKTWCVPGNETPPPGMSLLSFLTWDDVREVGLGKQLAALKHLSQGRFYHREWIRGVKEGI